MRRTEITYKQLDKALRSLGFTSYRANGEPPTLVYDHKETGASFMIPVSPETDFVLAYHLVGARTIANNFGVADPTVFDAQLQRAG